MSDTADLKLSNLAAVQAETHVTLSPGAAALVLSVGAPMPEHCRAPDAGGAR